MLAELDEVMSKCTAGSSPLFVIFICLRILCRKVFKYSALAVSRNGNKWTGHGVELVRQDTFVSVEVTVINNWITFAHVFRTTQNADGAQNEVEAEDILEMITDEVRLCSY